MPHEADSYSSLLRTKLETRPRPRRIVARPRLRIVLDHAEATRLILVSAPAGFGKSTLLADWLAASELPSAWLLLDSGDNDVVRFVACLGGAAAELAGRPQEAGAFAAARPFDAALALAPVLDLLAEAASRSRLVVVLDDYHVIVEPAVHRLVASLIDRLPAGARLAIATRADPQLPLARLRANGELLEVRADDLAFRVAEAAELLRESGLDLTGAEVDLLTSRTEGWAAALRLAAVALRDRTDREELVRGFGATHRYILDYVVEEVLAGLPRRTQDFLLETSILGRMSGPLCDAVTGELDGQAQLEALERANLLIVPLDDERCWYRYHALFGEVLRNRLVLLHPTEVGGLHRRAFTWHDQHGQTDVAIDHAVRSGDVELATQVVGAATLHYLNQGQLSMVRRWLDALPPAAVRADAHLSASYAWCLVLSGETAGAAERLADCERGLETCPDHGPVFGAILRPELALLRSRLAVLEADTTTAIEQARLALSLVPPGLPTYVEAIVRGDGSLLLADALLDAGDRSAAASAYEAALPDLRFGGNALGAAHVVGSLAEIDLANGDPARALARCEAYVGDAAERPQVADGAVWIAMGHAFAELGQLERGTSAARRGLDLVGRGGGAAAARAADEVLRQIAESERRASGTPSRCLADVIEPLTTREIEILRLVATGASNRQIAARLFLAVGTVKSHLHSISGKLGAANRVEAVARGRELGLVN